MPDHPPATPADPDDSFLNEFISGVDAGQFDGGSLEIDDRQEKEIRHIVLTTLPQYLLPVEQMARQLFDHYDPALAGTLAATVESVATAVARVGVTDVAGPLGQLHRQLQVLTASGASSPTVRGTILGLIEEATARASPSGGGGPVAPSEDAGPTLVEAFPRLSGIGEHALQKLTAAGLIMVDQILQARPDEIVSVSGLEPGRVNSLVRQLRERYGTVTPTATAPPSGTNRAAIPASIPEPPDASGPFGASVAEPAELEGHLQAQVEAEARTDKARADLLRAQVEVRAARQDLESVQAQKSETLGRLQSSRERLAAQLVTMSELRSEREAAAARLAKLQSAVSRAEERLAELSARRAEAAGRMAAVTADFAALVRRITLLKDACGTEHRDIPAASGHGSSS